MGEKVTVMVLKVDLQCASCYKKVKKVLCKFPQIRDQVYDEKANTVKITVVCCNPEKIRDKLCCKGAKAIMSIEIKEPPKPKEPEKPKEGEKPKAAAEKPKVVEKPKEAEKAKEPVKAAPAAIATQPVPVNFCEPIHGYPYMPMYPTGTCFEGYGGGPCYHGYGRPVPSSLGPYYDGYGHGYGYHANKSNFSSEYFIEENPQGCTIM